MTFNGAINYIKGCLCGWTAVSACHPDKVGHAHTHIGPNSNLKVLDVGVSVIERQDEDKRTL